MNKPKWTTHCVTMPVDKALEYLDKLLVVVNKQFLDPGYPIALSMAIDKFRAPLPDNPPCYVPEKDNPYPLCVGRGLDCCAECQLRGDWEPDDPYGVEGKASPDNKALTVEELREMDGEPVWIVAHPDWGHWELSERAEDYFEDRDEDFYGMTMPTTLPDPMGKYGLHMLGWLAYRRPPEKEEHHEV